MGYHRAGFDDITGVDIKPMPRYPFKFIQGDALEYLAAHGAEYDVIHASPPCQGYSRLSFVNNRDMSNYPKLIDDIRRLLVVVGKPYIVENVPDAPLINALTLCGTMFGLKTHRHRKFESLPQIWFSPAGCSKAPVKPKHRRERLGQYYKDPLKMATIAGHLFTLEVGKSAMGIDWMTKDEIAEAIPPAYTEWIGKQLLEMLR